MLILKHTSLPNYEANKGFGNLLNKDILIGMFTNKT